MKTITIFILALSLKSLNAWSTPVRQTGLTLQGRTSTALFERHDSGGTKRRCREVNDRHAVRNRVPSAAALISAVTVWTMTNAVAWADEVVEVAELPPPYVPVLIAVGLIAGVGLLTGSLGDVIDEESSLGLQSGARARKEIERSKSSYFKNKQD